MTNTNENIQRQLDQLSFDMKLHAQKVDMEIQRAKESDERIIRELREHIEIGNKNKDKLDATLERLSQKLDHIDLDVDKLSDRLKLEIESVNKLDEIQSQQIADSIATVKSIKEIFLLHQREMAEKEKNQPQQENQWQTWAKTNKVILGTLVFTAASFTTILTFWDKLMKLLGE